MQISWLFGQSSFKPLWCCQKAGGLPMCSNRTLGSSGSWVLWPEEKGLKGWMEMWASALAQSDLLFEGRLCSPGGGVSSGCLHRLIGHDACGKLLLSLLEAGTGGTVQCMDLIKWRARTDEVVLNRLLKMLPDYLMDYLYLFEHDEGQDSQWGKESSDEDHYNAHWDASIQASQSWDPPAKHKKVTY